MGKHRSLGETLYSDVLDSLGMAGVDQFLAMSMATTAAQDIEAHQSGIEQLKQLIGREQQLSRRSCCSGMMKGFNVRHQAGTECPCHGRHHEGGELVILLTSGQIAMVETFIGNYREVQMIRQEVGHTLFRLNTIRHKWNAPSLTRESVELQY